MRLRVCLLVAVLCFGTLAGHGGPQSRCDRGNATPMRDRDVIDIRGFRSPDPRPAGVPVPVLFIGHADRTYRPQFAGETATVTLRAVWASPNDYAFRVWVDDEYRGDPRESAHLPPGSAPSTYTVVLEGLTRCSEIWMDVDNRLGDPFRSAKVQVRIKAD